jgi:hypothetical protein
MDFLRCGRLILRNNPETIRSLTVRLWKAKVRSEMH